MTNETKVDEGNLMKCPDCDGKMAKSANNCPHCGSTTYQKKVAEEAEKVAEEAEKAAQEIEEKTAQETEEKAAQEAALTKQNKGCGCLVAIVLSLLFFIWIAVGMKNTPESCWSIGYNYGYAAARAAKGLDPGPYGNLTMPKRCIGDPSTDKGVLDGAAAAY